MRVKLMLVGLVSGAALAVAAISTGVFAGYAPANRPTFQCITPTNCPGANYVVFNSFTNAPNYGDERAFFDAKDATITTSGGYQDRLTVKDGQKIVMRMYVHNNANPKAIGEAAATAKNTRLQALLPTSKKTNHVAAAQITADNANPGTVSDTVDLTGANPFTVAFDKNAPVQVTYRPNGTGDWVTRTLPSAVFSNDHTMNANVGDWKGCFEYGALVTFTAKVQMDKEQVTPKFKCENLTLTKLEGRQVRATVNHSSTGATFKSVKFEWGDSSTPTITDQTSATHTFDKDGRYTVRATLTFKLNGQDKSDVTDVCTAEVSFETPPPSTPPTPPTPPSPPELPDTGPAGVVGLFAGISAAAAAGHYIVTGRRGL